MLDAYPPESFADQPGTVAMQQARSPHAEMILHAPNPSVPPIVHIAAAARTKLVLGQKKPIVSMTSEIVKKVQGMPHKESLNIHQTRLNCKIHNGDNKHSHQSIGDTEPNQRYFDTDGSFRKYVIQLMDHQRSN